MSFGEGAPHFWCRLAVLTGALAMGCGLDDERPDARLILTPGAGGEPGTVGVGGASAGQPMLGDDAVRWDAAADEPYPGACLREVYESDVLTFRQEQRYTHDGQVLWYRSDYTTTDVVDEYQLNQYDEHGHVTYARLELGEEVAQVERSSDTHDAAGRIISQDVDIGDDGRIDRRLTQAFDERGNLVASTSDDDFDGQIDSTYEATYFDNDVLASAHSRRPEGASRRTYNRDGQDLRQEADFDGDGTFEYWQEIGYDSAGRVLTKDSSSLGSEIWSYDDQEHNTQILVFNADGSTNRRYQFEWDSAGNMIAEQWDNQDDGSIESRSLHTYDGAGNRLTTDLYSFGELVRRITQRYDSDSQLVEVNRDLDADGQVDERDTFEYAGARPVFQQQSRFTNGVELSTWHRIELDDAGNVVEESRGSKSAILERATHTWDEHHNLLTSSVDLGDDGVVDRRTVNTYDCFVRVEP